MGYYECGCEYNTEHTCQDDQDENCEHYGIECEQPCACRCEPCSNAALDYYNEINETLER